MRLKKLACIAMMSVMATGLVACGSDNNKGTEAGTGAGSAQTQSTAATKAENDNTPFVEEPDTAPYEELETNKNGMVIKGSDLRVIYDLDDYPASFWDAQNKYSTATNRKVAQGYYNKLLGKEFGVLKPVCQEYSVCKTANDIGYKLTLKPEEFLYMGTLENDDEADAIKMYVLLNDGNFFDLDVEVQKVRAKEYEKEFGAIKEEFDGWELHEDRGAYTLVKKLDTQSDAINVVTIELSGTGSGHSMQFLRESRCIELFKKVKDCVSVEKLDYVPVVEYLDVKSVDESALKISDKVTVTVPEDFKMINWRRIDNGATAIGVPGFGGRNFIRYQKENESLYELSWITVVEADGDTVDSIEEEFKGKELKDVSSDGVKMYENYKDDGYTKSYVRYIEANDTIYSVSFEITNYAMYPETAARFDDICKNLVKIN